MGLTCVKGLGALTLTSALVAFTASGAQAAFECPVKGGDLVFGQEAKVNSLDMHASSTISTRNIAMHMFEALMTRDEDNNPILELAEAVDISDDGLVYTFTLRDGIKFHNGKEMTSEDVAASFERYKTVGIENVILSNVASWETPDPSTFVINMSQAQPTFLEDLSSFSVPIVIVPARTPAPIRSSSSRSAPGRSSSSSSSPTATSSSSATRTTSPTSSSRSALASAATRSPASTP